MATSLLLVLLGAWGVVSGRDAVSADRLLVLTSAVGYGLLGPWVWAHAVPVIGRRMSAVGVAAALNWAAQGWSGYLGAAWASQWTWLVPVLLVPLVLCRFPTSAALAPLPRLLEQVLTAAAAASASVLAVAALGAPRSLVVGEAPQPTPSWSLELLRLVLVPCGVWLLATVAQLAVLARRWWADDGVDRGRLLCLAAALLVTLGGLGGLVVDDGEVAQLVVALALPVGFAAAVWRYGLYDLDLRVHRALVWLVLTAAVVAGVVVGSWLVTTWVPAPWDSVAQVALVSGLVLLLDPARRVVQRGVGRALFGRRDTPVEALGFLGAEIGSATAGGSSELLCRSVAATLALPWVGLRRGEEVVAVWGRATSEPLVVPLETTQPAALLLGPRRAGERFGAADLRLVPAIASQVAVAVRALDLADDLQAARERLVRSREEERKRLRDDLHDGLGPTLAGLRLQVRALRAGAPDVWRGFDDDLAACALEVTRVVDGLRPPQLDGGLVAALQREVVRWRRLGLEVRSEVDDRVPGLVLPAAAETALYRIAAEALSNAARHAAAGTVEIGLTLLAGPPLALRLVVADDGTGVVVPRLGGVGLASMRDRAEELGGTFTLLAHPGGGTAVEAVVPVGVARSSPGTSSRELGTPSLDPGTARPRRSARSR